MRPKQKSDTFNKYKPVKNMIGSGTQEEVNICINDCPSTPVVIPLVSPGL